MSAAELALIQARIEAVLFMSNDPVPAQRLSELLNVDLSGIRKVTKLLKKHYDSPDRGIELKEISGGYHFRTKREHADIIKEAIQAPPPKLVSFFDRAFGRWTD